MRPYYLREVKDAVGNVLGYVVYRQHEEGERPLVMAEFRTDRAGASCHRPCADLPTAFRLAHGMVEALNG